MDLSTSASCPIAYIKEPSEAVKAGQILQCVRKCKFVVTTNSNHGLHLYPNLAADMAPTSVDQLWRADITCIRLREEFVFRYRGDALPAVSGACAA
jgi:hypothetical protein